MIDNWKFDYLIRLVLVRSHFSAKKTAFKTKISIWLLLFHSFVRFDVRWLSFDIRFDDVYNTIHFVSVLDLYMSKSSKEISIYPMHLEMIESYLTVVNWRVFSEIQIHLNDRHLLSMFDWMASEDEIFLLPSVKSERNDVWLYDELFLHRLYLQILRWVYVFQRKRKKNRNLIRAKTMRTNDKKDLLDVLKYLYKVLACREIDDDQSYHDMFVHLCFHLFALDD